MGCYSDTNTGHAADKYEAKGDMCLIGEYERDRANQKSGTKTYAARCAHEVLTIRITVRRNLVHFVNALMTTWKLYE